MGKPPSLPRRGLSGIQTMSDLVTETSNPQRKYLKLAMLSMERVRRGKERTSAQERVRDIDRRTAEIDASRRELLRLAQEECDLEEPEHESRGTRRSPGRPPGGLKLKY